MKAVRSLVAALAVCTIALVSACGERPPTAAPELQAPNPSLIGGLLSATGLLKCSDLPYASNTATIGSAGGVLNVGPHTLSIPAGALASPVTITGEIVTGRKVNAVHFEPDGLRFSRSASLTMSYANCNLLGSLAPKRIAYVSGGLDILYYLLSIDNLLAKKVTGRVDHFSDYAVAW
jgi:hypothetical protein